MSNIMDGTKAGYAQDDTGSTTEATSNSTTGACTLHAEQEAPFERAAELLAETAEALFQERNRLRLAIPGGSAMKAALLLKVKLGADWSRVALTWVDERCVAADDPDSNYGAARQAGIERGAAAATILPLFQKGESPQEAVDRVAAQLKNEFAAGLDLLLLGMGEDGHIASIFPDPRTRPPPHTDTAAQASRWVEHIAQSPKPPPNRITLTRPFLGTARRAVLVALGEGKRAPLERLLSGDASLPAFGLSDLQVVTDLALPSPPFPSPPLPSARIS